MEQFNKALSFILGLVVVAVFIIVASGKFNIKGLNLPKTQTKVAATPTTIPLITPKPTSKPWFSFFSKPATTPTPKLVVKPTNTPLNTIYVANNTGTGSVQPQQPQEDPNYHSYSGVNAPTSIPNTGVPFVVLPLLGTSLFTGIFIKRIGKK